MNWVRPPAKPFFVVVALLMLSLLSVSIVAGTELRNDGSVLDHSIANGATWARAFGGMDGGSNRINSVAKTADGGFALVGVTTSYSSCKCDADFWVLRTDGSGLLKWQKVYGGTGYEEATSIVVAQDGSLFVIGRTTSYGNSTGGLGDIWILKLDSNGNMVWQKSFGGLSDDYAQSGILTSDGYLIVSGYVKYGGNYIQGLILKLDLGGNLQWEKLYDYDLFNQFDSVVETSDGYYVATGYTNPLGGGTVEAWVVKTDSDGVMVWQKTIGNSSFSSMAYSVAAVSGGGIVFAGKQSTDGWLVQLDSNGSEQWEKTYSAERVRRIVPSNSGGFLVGGWINTIGARDFWLAKVDAVGVPVWQKAYGGSSGETLNGLAVLRDGGYVAVGTTNSFGVFSESGWVVKLSSDGSLGGSCNIIADTTITPQIPTSNVSSISATPAVPTLTPIASNATPAAVSWGPVSQCASLPYFFPIIYR